ncbi:MAG: DUF2914 domain-containing protein [Candidatus Methylomirabilales bacterium]
MTNARAQSETPGHEAPARRKPTTATAKPRIIRDALATAVIDREPEQVVSPIPADVGRLYYFTEVVEAASPTTILHLWYWRNRNINVVILDVNGPRFRTWSYKTIPPTWTGDWRVEARTPDGTILSSKAFRVEPTQGTGYQGTDSPR